MSSNLSRKDTIQTSCTTLKTGAINDEGSEGSDEETDFRKKFFTTQLTNQDQLLERNNSDKGSKNLAKWKERVRATSCRISLSKNDAPLLRALMIKRSMSKISI